MNEGLCHFTLQTDANPGGCELNTAETARMVNRGDRIFWRKRGVRSADTMNFRQRMNAERSEQMNKGRVE